MQQILNHVKRLGEEVALERLEGPVGNETHDSDGQNEKPKNGSVHGHPEVKVALIDASNKRTRAHATELEKGDGKEWDGRTTMSEKNERLT